MILRAGIHRGHPGEAGRIGEGGGGPRQGDDPVFQRRGASRASRRNSGSSSRRGRRVLPAKPTAPGRGTTVVPDPGGPRGGRRLTSPGRGMLPPPMRPASEMEWWGAEGAALCRHIRHGLRQRRPPFGGPPALLTSSFQARQKAWPFRTQPSALPASTRDRRDQPHPWPGTASDAAGSSVPQS
jgi:hypothetical protein